MNNDIRKALTELPEPRMLALDLDGTLLTNDKRLTARTCNALKNALASGIEIVLITGRPCSGLPFDLEPFPGIRYVISSNGSVTTDIRTGERIRSACIDSETACRIAELPMDLGFIHSIFIDGIGYCEPPFYDMLYEFFRGTALESYVKASRRAVNDLRSLIKASPQKVENIWIIADSVEGRIALGEHIEKSWDVHIVSTAPDDLEITHPDADKGLALEHIAGVLGIQKEYIMAIGDNDNDLGMFAYAGIPVAMGNGTPAAKGSAVIITDTNENDGAAQIIEKVLKL